MTSADPLKFEDTKKYTDRVKNTIAKSGLNDAVKTAHGTVNGEKLVVACMDFGFIGGSMGSVVGEKIAKAIDQAIKLKCPIYDDFKIRWSAYDGSWSFINANGKNFC